MPDAKPHRKRRRRTIIAVLVVVVVAVVGVLVAGQLLTVKTVRVSGTVNQDPEEVRTTSGIESGDRMAGVDTGSAASAVSQLAWIDTVTVTRSWPSTVKIAVTEHNAVGVLDDGGTPVVIDDRGRQFLRGAAPEGTVPVQAQASDDAAVSAAAEVLSALAPLGPDFRAQLAEVDAPAADRVTLRFRDNREVYWGTAERAAEKAEATRVVLTREGAKWNVSNPAMPAVHD